MASTAISTARVAGCSLSNCARSSELTGTRWFASAAAAALLWLAGCAGIAPPAGHGAPPSPGCSTAAAAIAFDIETAPQPVCTVLGERSFALLISPEHAPPINPSPWYAFRYTAPGGQGISVRLDYLEAKHRYAPKLLLAGTVTPLPVTVAEDSRSAQLTLPAGDGVVAAQEPFGQSRYDALLTRLSALPQTERIELGRSLDGRPVTGLRLGRATAPALVVLLGRQHPPETTGAVAMEAFLIALSEQMQDDPGIGERVQFFAVPELNPDGVARGHWRANRGGVDLNRDWGEFSQPETRAVKAWLDARPSFVKPVAMLDFHSTWRNLFYVQGEVETTAREERFLAGWLGQPIEGYPFTIERRDANPGSGTAKNWFRRTFDTPSYTYEVGDDTSPTAIRHAARSLARSYISHIDALIEDQTRP
jgi:hypothetical protein